MDSLLDKGIHLAPHIEEAGPREESSIQWVSCVIRPEKLDDVKNALNGLNLVGGMTVADVRGFGRQKGQLEHYRGGEILIRFLDKVRLDLVVSKDDVEEVIKVIREKAQTGSVGDGKVFVTDVQTVLRIRTGEMGMSAL